MDLALTPLDRKLLHLLEEDARRSYTELAALLGVSRMTVKNRVDRLVDKGVIETFTIRLAEAGANRPKVPAAMAFFHLKLKRPFCKTVFETIETWPEVLGAWSIAGETDMTLLINCPLGRHARGAAGAAGAPSRGAGPDDRDDPAPVAASPASACECRPRRAGRHDLARADRDVGGDAVTTKPRANSFVLISTQINRCIFEGNVDEALILIGDYMQQNGMAASLEVVAAIPTKAVPNRPPRSVQ